MANANVSPIRKRLTAVALLLCAAGLVPTARAADKRGSTPAKSSAPAARPASSGSKSSGASASGHAVGGSTTTHPGPSANAGRPAIGTTHVAGGGTVTHTASGKEIVKSPTGRVTSVKTAAGHEARFGANGQVREVHANGMTVSRGPGGVRRTEIEREDHSRLVAYGHGRGYIQHPYQYGGHAYYSRAYYYHGGYYRGYYRGYYYHGAYLYGYRPAYYYPPVYYGWAYNPWAAPVYYGWGWGAAPWYGYYGAYFAPYPVYPGAAYWLVDYMVAASLADAYAAAAANNSADLGQINPARLVFASYDPDTGTTSPTMTKEVKDAVADEIKLELAAAQKAADPAEGNSGSLQALFADGKPHVFVASAALTVTSSGTECGLTEGDVLALNSPPADEASAADLRVLASKQSDCVKGSVVKVELADLQEMHNHLLSSIDKGMAQMKDHPGQGGLPAPPAEAISGTKPAPYADAAPPADADGAAQLDQAAQQGAQTEQQVVAEANAPDPSGASAQAGSVGGTAIGAMAAAAPAPTGPVTISLGQTPEQVIAEKGQPVSKVNLAAKTIFNYPDMKIIFVKGKVSDVQ